MTSPDSQNSAILSALKAGRILSPLDALREFGCMRLGARIWGLAPGRPSYREVLGNRR